MGNVREGWTGHPEPGGAKMGVSSHPTHADPDASCPPPLQTFQTREADEQREAEEWAEPRDLAARPTFSA